LNKVAETVGLISIGQSDATCKVILRHIGILSLIKLAP
jgi:hypothetical protein